MTLGFGIVGYGKMAEIQHRVQIGKVKEARLVAVCDPLPVRRELAKSQGARPYEDFDAFLGDADLDVVVVATPSNSHAEYAVRAAQAGKHVLSEKPMAPDAAAAERMIDAARKNKVVLTVYHNRRYDGDVQAVMKVLRSGKLGRILAIESRVNSWGSARGFGIKEFHQDWRIESAWGGGALYDFGPHLFDQLLLMVDSPVASVYADMQQGVHAKDCDDYACGIIRFANGTMALAEINFMTHAPLPRFNIIGEKGTLQSEAGRHGALLLHWADGRRITRVPPVQTPVDQIYHTLVRAIAGKKGDLAAPPEHCLRVMRLMDAYRASARSGKSVELKGESATFTKSRRAR